MPKRFCRKGALSHRSINLFVPPPPIFYEKPTLYWCGDELEIEHFTRIMDFSPGALRVRLRGRILIVTGDALVLSALEKDRIRISGRLLRIEFASE